MNNKISQRSTDEEVLKDDTLIEITLMILKKNIFSERFSIFDITNRFLCFNIQLNERGALEMQRPCSVFSTCREFLAINKQTVYDRENTRQQKGKMHRDA